MSKNVIITGTSRGIGFEMAKLFAANNHNVLCLSRNEHIELNQKNITQIPFDLSLETAYQKVTEFVSENWDNHVDILINNAGLLINKPFDQITTKNWQDIYHVNVFGVAELIKTTLPFLKAKSHVITISSMGGIQGSMKFPGLAAYSSSKGAVITLSEVLAEEYKERQIAFNVLALGAVQTEMLAAAFPDYQAPLTASEMGAYIYNFALTGNQFYNGKTLEVSSSTP